MEPKRDARRPFCRTMAGTTRPSAAAAAMRLASDAARPAQRACAALGGHCRCTPCAENSYKSVVGGQCKSCPVGTSTIGEDRSFCRCDAGRYGPQNRCMTQTVCRRRPGSYGGPGPGNCTLVLVMQKSRCARRRRVRTIATIETQPLLGRDGKACQACPAGTRGEIGAGALDECQKCPPGTYQPVTGADEADDCKVAPQANFPTFRCYATCVHRLSGGHLWR